MGEQSTSRAEPTDGLRFEYENHQPTSWNRQAFGFEAVGIYRAILRQASVIKLVRNLLYRAYLAYMGEEGGRFIEYCFKEMDRLPSSPDINEIQSVFLRTREEFRKRELYDLYLGSFRSADLERTIQMAGRENLVGTVVDLGAGDNSFGRLLRELGIASRVVGIDVVRPSDVQVCESPALHFLLSGKSETLPKCAIRELLDGEPVQVVVNRYSLHHMTRAEQTRILEAEREIMAPDGRIVVIEDAYSFNLTPQGYYNDKSLHRRMINLGSIELVHLFIAGLDVAGHFWREKNQPFPWTYNSVEGWVSTFNRLGFSVVESRYFGLGLMPPAPTAVFVLSPLT